MYNNKEKGNGKMKRVFFLLFVPFVAFAICQECDSFRSSLLTRNQDITAEVQGIGQDVGLILSWSASIANSTTESNAETLANNIYAQAAILQARADIVLEMLASNRVDILAFNCYCDSSSGCECAGVLTNIYESLQYIEGYSRETSYGMETLLHDLETFKSAVVDGFVNVSNQLHEVVSSIDSVLTNRFNFTTSPGKDPFMTFQWWQNNRNNFNLLTGYYLRNNMASSISDAVKLMAFVLPRASTSLNNYFYDYSYFHFPNLTNTVGTLTRESTNFFSFFRGEIGVRGVLEDWTEQDGSYYDFLTNHYIQVVTGGTLSGNQSQKTNWFARVETLLASLVFTDSDSTNTVDSSSAEQQSKEITSHFEEVNSLASNVVQDFSEKSEDIVELFRSWCQQFDSASLPSHVVLFTVPSEGEDLVIQFSLSDTPEVVAMVEGMRAITTFCWASVGIFLLYKFLVWSARCVFVACQFIYKAVSAIFK